MTIDKIIKKREYIVKAISSDRYDNDHAQLWMELSKSVSNLDGVINDIDNYNRSVRAINQSNKLFVLEQIASMVNPILITFTTKFDISNLEITTRYQNAIKHVSKIIFKNAYKRYGKLISHIAYIEGGNDKRIHIHAVVDMPHRKDITFTKFKNMFSEHWYKTTGTIDFREVGDNYNDSETVANYITKLKSKESFLTIQDALII